MIFKKVNEQAIRAEGYANGHAAGLFEAHRQEQDLIERKATNLFCESGYPNPLHVFDLSPTGIPYLAQEPITKARATQLKQEASLLKTMDLYDVITETIKQEAIKKAVILSKTWEETLAGKMMLANLGIIRKIIESISAIDTEKLPEGIGGSSQGLV